jgi:hypothetical protein
VKYFTDLFLIVEPSLVETWFRKDIIIMSGSMYDVSAHGVFRRYLRRRHCRHGGGTDVNARSPSRP